uniref:Uncharacterized protein n=1 Tax=Triticum urartu TaxID=4572 RepID=A0A8R7V8B1_TRIUA
SLVHLLQPRAPEAPTTRAPAGHRSSSAASFLARRLAPLPATTPRNSHRPLHFLSLHFPVFFSLLTTPAPRVLFHRERHGLLRSILRCLPEPAAYPAPRAQGPRARARPRARLRGSSSRWPPLRQVHRHHRPIVRPPSLLLLAVVNFRRAANDSSSLYFEQRRTPSSRHTSTPARLHS